MHGPESVEYNSSLVELIARVKNLCGNDGSISESGRFAAHLLTVDQDVISMGPVNSQEEQTYYLKNSKI